MFEITLNFLETHWGNLTLIAVGGFYLVRYMSERANHLRWQEFEKYHGLIKELVSATDPRVDRQTAAIYELRYFKRYYEHSVRMLKHLKESWNAPKEAKAKAPKGAKEKAPEEIAREERTLKRYNEEIDITIKFIEGKIKSKKDQG